MSFEGFSAVVLFCSDTEASRAWYEKAGLPYLRGYQGMHWFSLGGSGEVMLHPSEAEVAAGCKPEVNVQVSDIDAYLDQVSRAGLRPFDHERPDVPLTAPVTRPWGVREINLEDPDGYRWAFFSPA